jgi:two-component system, NtrC family, sensor histidine kinase KinB
MAPDRATSSLELLYRIGRQLVSSLDLQTVLEQVLTLSTQNLGAERGTLIVLDEFQRPAQAAIVLDHQLIPYTMDQLREVIDQGLAGWVLRSRQPALIPDTSHDERWVRRPDDQADRSGAKSAVCIPLLSRDQLVGVLTLVHRVPDFFKPAHLELLQAIGDQAGTAINNARLYDSLQAATQRYRELFENSIDPILITDTQGKILEVNRQMLRMAGASHSGFIATSILNLHEPNWVKLGENFSALQGGEMVSYESAFRLPGSQPVPVEIYVYRVHLKDEDDLQWTVRDITARKELDHMRTDLSAMIYHDLRSPLSNIISSLDMLEGFLPVEETASLRTIFGIASRSTERMQRLISSLLDINRLEAGQPITNRKAIEVNGLVAEAIDAIQPTLEGKQQAIESRLPPPGTMILVDEDMIRRVLINLLDNATKFTPMKGKMGIWVENLAGEVRFCVRDSGLGIQADAIEYIFEKFRQATPDGQPKGFGLGLAFCRLAVQAHGGRIWAESEPGKGSQFFFTLPTAR